MPISGCSKISVQAAGPYISGLHHSRFPGKRRPSLDRRLIEQEAEDAAGNDDGDGTDFAEE